MSLDVQAIVIDYGSSFMKVGFAGDDAPRAVFPSIIGKPNEKNVPITPGTHDLYVGEEPESWRLRNQLPKFPISRSIIIDWDGFEKLLHHSLYNELQISPEEHPMLISESAMNSKVNREKMTETLFETFNIPAFCIAVNAVLSLCSMNQVSGVMLESGGGISIVVPVYEGYVLRNAVIELDLAGGDVSKYLEKILMESGHSITEEIIINNIKENACEVALNFELEMNSDEKTKFELPDGTQIDIGPSERFQCTEIMFQPSLIGMECNGIHEIIYRSIGYCEIDIRKELYNNIGLGGGNTLFKGFSERLNKELTNLAPSSININVHALPDRRYSSWIGGSILASSESFDSLPWILKEEYEEFGASIVHRKCF
ncbi:hypothetical protein NAEGRDRAFT_60433 [Naegleria gruberi]|uniref:Actin n=1 Tax=Naegleria gruberi TaxID=5762 RepID=D2V8A6_NAEGR|nr:uncharacterized protein NAEGRDRAFT_60433 [Naegleria gruberi]EFC47145.1 hypothetical protein NAEGRDRAFT_60433 [Naegleria gruberi]|eukprot:XP_002679889.1 hypothetical protein NAEGRDRAFT_60433 [Naegleria gruberi strain NEG-M]